VEGEGEVGVRRGQDAAARGRGGVEGELPRRLARDQVLGNLPSRMVGVGDADVQSAARLKAATTKRSVLYSNR
jgi:hypothetical protein